MTLLSRPWPANPRVDLEISGPKLEGQALSAGRTRDLCDKQGQGSRTQLSILSLSRVS